MGVIGDTLSSYTVPTAGTTAGPTYASQISSLLTELKTRCSQALGVASLAIDGALSMASYAITNIARLNFAELADADIPTTGPALYFHDDGDLYAVDGSDRTVRVTDSGTLNISSVGGFEGDYETDEAVSARYTTSTGLFSFFKSFADAYYATIAAYRLKLYFEDEDHYVTVTPVTGLSADVEVNLPGADRTFLAANPAGTSLLTISDAGVEAATLTPSITSLTITDDDVLHSAREITQDASDGEANASHATFTGSVGGAPAFWVGAGSSGIVSFRCPAAVGDRIKSAAVRVTPAAGTITVKAFDVNVMAGSQSQVGDTKTSSGTAAQTIDITTWVNTTLATGHAMSITVQFDGSYASQTVWGAKWTFDRVA